MFKRGVLAWRRILTDQQFRGLGRLGGKERTASPLSVTKSAFEVHLGRRAHYGRRGVH